jgi:hypothetical protein
MSSLEKFIEGIPWPIKATVLFGGSLMSAFSSKFPDQLQTIGLYFGIALATVGFFALIWRTLGWLVIGTGLGCAIFVVSLSYIASGGDWSVMTIAFREQPSRLSNSISTAPIAIKHEDGPFAVARFLYDKTSDSMLLLMKDGIDVANVDRDATILQTSPAIAPGGSFIARFVFHGDQGPYRIDVTSEQFGPPFERYAVSIVENEKSHVKLKLSPSIGYESYGLAVMGEKKSAEITISFYEKISEITPTTNPTPATVDLKGHVENNVFDTIKGAGTGTVLKGEGEVKNNTFKNISSTFPDAKFPLSPLTKEEDAITNGEIRNLLRRYDVELAALDAKITAARDNNNEREALEEEFNALYLE